MRARIAFLTRLVTLKITTLFAFVLLSLYTPSTMNRLLDGAGAAAKVFANWFESGLEALGRLFGDVTMLMPKKGAVELTVRYVGMEKVLLFIGMAIALYLGWLLVIAGARGAWRTVDASGSPRAKRNAPFQPGPPR